MLSRWRGKKCTRWWLKRELGFWCQGSFALLWSVMYVWKLFTAYGPAGQIQNQSGLQCLHLSHVFPHCDPLTNKLTRLYWLQKTLPSHCNSSSMYIQWKYHACWYPSWFDTNLLWWLSSLGAELHLHWWQLCRSTNLFSDDIRWLKAWADPVIRGEILNSRFHRRQQYSVIDDQCGICQVRRHWWQNDWDRRRLDGHHHPGHLGDQQKRDPGQFQSPILLKPNA